MEKGEEECTFMLLWKSEPKDYFVNIRKISLSIVLWLSTIGTFFYVNHSIPQKSTNWEWEYIFCTHNSSWFYHHFGDKCQFRSYTYDVLALCLSFQKVEMRLKVSNQYIPEQWDIIATSVWPAGSMLAVVTGDKKENRRKEILKQSQLFHTQYLKEVEIEKKLCSKEIPIKEKGTCASS